MQNASGAGVILPLQEQKERQEVFLMKKHYFAALILALVLALAGSSAESIFPTIPEEGTDERWQTQPRNGWKRTQKAGRL